MSADVHDESVFVKSQEFFILYGSQTGQFQCSINLCIILYTLFFSVLKANFSLFY